MSWLRFVGLRLAGAVVLALCVSTLVFLLLRVIPGDAVEVMLGEHAAPADRVALRARLGLDRPLGMQWLSFVQGLVQGDIGHSLVDGRPVAELLALHFPYTLALAATALALACVIALPLGVGAARQRGGRLDRLLEALTLIGVSLPSFVLGPLLIVVFAVGLRWLPVSGADDARSIVLPAVCLALGLAAVLARMTRASLLEVARERYILAARARGLTEWRITLRHAGPNAALPVLTTLGLQLGGLLGGAVVTEIVFGWPGLGQLAIEAIERRDYPVVQGCVLLASLCYIAINVAVDMSARALDPRLEASA